MYRAPALISPHLPSRIEKGHPSVHGPVSHMYRSLFPWACSNFFNFGVPFPANPSITPLSPSPSPPDTFKLAVGMRAVGIRWKCLFVPVAFENYAKCSASMRKLHPADKQGTVPGVTIGKRLIRVRGGFLKVAGPFLNYGNKNRVQTRAMINTGKTPELIYWRYIKRYRKSGLMVECIFVKNRLRKVQSLSLMRFSTEAT